MYSVGYWPKDFKEDTAHTPDVHFVGVVAIGQETFRSPIPVLKTREYSTLKATSVTSPHLVNFKYTVW